MKVLRFVAQVVRPTLQRLEPRLQFVPFPPDRVELLPLLA
jgi:hypothetical protein